ncbi:alpha-ketoglutarate-dependent dioxygenase AlkB [Sedimentimonas flavescens]|uniref:Alpha-ketoglutarate-dependent dioxygenase AlkB n=1 Tax=Sedimentimonas flavescens TaxID=2851012 RepID=A0ABT2ZZG1_9RHOB|nr:alpha-ketoglutarate-dependent dioxygenase AlkB [Sedimentimonas flavescens]MCV2879142.1 alpha-ketoglutarate-dependent dioxygenase AlkB [Sedimentimonas flavescens]
MNDSAESAPKRPDPQEIRGFLHFPGWLTAPEQQALVAQIRAVVAAAPFFSPMTPYGKPMSVRMTSAGRFGWVSDRRGYRYSETHPSGTPWPAIPPMLTTIWNAVCGTDRQPECCLINFYPEGARMGLHQDRDEADFTQPVVSVSLGDDGLFRIGNQTRGGSTQSLWLRSGDVLVMGGPARLTYHGIDRVAPGTSTLLPKGGRINLTMRVVT